MIPDALPPLPSNRDQAKRLYNFNVEMTRLAKDAAHKIGTGGMEVILAKMVQMTIGEFKDAEGEPLESVEMPMEVVRQTNLFAVVAVSRLLMEMIKYENSTGTKLEGVVLTEEEGS